MSWSALSPGDAVEVSDDRGESTWQSASIIQPFINRHMYFVAFDNAIKATVSSVRVRPRPESGHFASDFELNQAVDIRFGSVWRPGVVRKVHVAEGRKFYGVNVADTQMEIEHGSAEIRAAVDWINGKWALATHRGKFTKSCNLGNSHSDSGVLHKNKTSCECKAADVNSTRDLINEAPCEKLIATPMTNSENKGIPTFQPCKIIKDLDSVSPSHDCTVYAIQSSVASSNLDKENLGSSDNLNFQTCKRARKEDTLKDNSRILDIEKPTHSKCVESSSPKELEPDACMPVSNEDSDFNIKSMVDKLHFSCLFKSKESTTNNLNQESGGSYVKAEHQMEKSMHNEPLTKLCGEGISSHVGPRNTSSKPEGLLHKVACRHTSEERRRKKSKPKKIVIVEPSLEGSGRSFAFIEYIGYNHHISWGKNPIVQNIKESSLPFKKSSILWECVKSMEIFTVMPQNPHFSPLVKHCSEYPEGMDREAMAIGLMITFSKVVDDIHSLNISDPPEKFDEIAKALLNLQWHGFNVEKVQSRFVELIQLKKINERLANKTSTLKTAVAESTTKVKSSDGNLLEMEKNLCHLHELLDQILAEKKERDSKLGKLMEECSKFDANILLAKIAFEHARSFP